jgi:hypothetical protein
MLPEAPLAKTELPAYGRTTVTALAVFDVDQMTFTEQDAAFLAIIQSAELMVAVAGAHTVPVHLEDESHTAFTNTELWLMFPFFMTKVLLP